MVGPSPATAWTDTALKVRIKVAKAAIFRMTKASWRAVMTRNSCS
jgi:hypothetical protein